MLVATNIPDHNRVKMFAGASPYIRRSPMDFTYISAYVLMCANVVAVSEGISNSCSGSRSTLPYFLSKWLALGGETV